MSGNSMVDSIYAEDYRRIIGCQSQTCQNLGEYLAAVTPNCFNQRMQKSLQDLITEYFSSHIVNRERFAADPYILAVEETAFYRVVWLVPLGNSIDGRIELWNDNAFDVKNIK